MSKTYRLGAIGFAHQHINTLLDRFAELSNVEWVACADTVPATPSLCGKRSTRGYNLRRAREVIGIPKAYDDYRQMLEKERFDVIVFCPENARHGEVAEAIAEHGAHMVTEKPMSATLADALRMARAAQAHDVTLVVNWPSTWSPAIRKMKELIDRGAVGRVWEVKHRNGASMGPLAYGTGADVLTDEEKGAEWWHQASTGGGALLDYCCYGACLARWFIGEPAVAAQGICANIASHYGDADDNAVITVRFPQALAALEGTWTTWNMGVPAGPIVYGERGTLVSTTRQVPTEGSVGVVNVYTSRSHGLSRPEEVIEGDPLPAGRETLAKEVIHHLKTGDPLHPMLQLQHNLETMAILDAGLRSARSGRAEAVDSAVWCVGRAEA